MKLVKMIAGLVVTVALVLVLAGCWGDQQCTMPNGDSCGSGPDEHSIVHNDRPWEFKFKP